MKRRLSHRCPLFAPDPLIIITGSEAGNGFVRNADEVVRNTAESVRNTDELVRNTDAKININNNIKEQQQYGGVAVAGFGRTGLEALAGKIGRTCFPKLSGAFSLFERSIFENERRVLALRAEHF